MQKSNPPVGKQEYKSKFKMDDFKKKHLYTLAIVSAFIEKDNKYLLIYDPRFSCWRVPGGKVAFGEKIEDALLREMKEELKVKLDIDKFLGFGQDKMVFKKKFQTSRIIFYFRCKIKSDEINPDQKEISKYKWLSLSEIKKHRNLEGVMKDYFRRFC